MLEIHVDNNNQSNPVLATSGSQNGGLVCRPVKDGEGVEVAPGLAGAELGSRAAEILEDAVRRVTLDGKGKGSEHSGDDPTRRRHSDAHRFFPFEVTG